MSHDAHEAHPGYSPQQILKDGCAECRQRSASPWLAISHMDRETFGRAWGRAIAFERGQIDDVSHAEVPVLRVLWALALKFEERGFLLGPVPGPFDEFAELPL